jgi:hypothetical protein
MVRVKIFDSSGTKVGTSALKQTLAHFVCSLEESGLVQPFEQVLYLDVKGKGKVI